LKRTWKDMKLNNVTNSMDKTGKKIYTPTL